LDALENWRMMQRRAITVPQVALAVGVVLFAH